MFKLTPGTIKALARKALLTPGNRPVVCSLIPDPITALAKSSNPSVLKVNKYFQHSSCLTF